MDIVIIDRTDFAGNKDSEGKEYFDYILSSLGIDDRLCDIDSIELSVYSFNVFPKKEEPISFEIRKARQKHSIT